MPDSSRVDLDELKSKLSAATRGPWTATSCLDSWVETEDGIGIAQTGDVSWLTAEGVPNTQGEMEANALFIVAARNLLPDLIKELEELRARHAG